MNETQAVFTLFFAVIWGAVANVQPRWKAFHWPLVGRVWQATCRVFLSFVLFNLLPIAFFGWFLCVVQVQPFDPKVGGWTAWRVFLVVLHGIVPAFSLFGLYRVWLGVVELVPRVFYVEYVDGLDEQYRKAEPTIAQLWYLEKQPFNVGQLPADVKACYAPVSIPIPTCAINLLFGVVYLAVAFTAPHLFR